MTNREAVTRAAKTQRPADDPHGATRHVRERPSDAPARRVDRPPPVDDNGRAVVVTAEGRPRRAAARGDGVRRDTAADLITHLVAAKQRLTRGTAATRWCAGARADARPYGRADTELPDAPVLDKSALRHALVRAGGSRGR